MMRMHMIFSITALLLWGASAQAASDDDAKAHFIEGKKSYTAGRYQAAITEFKAAAKIRPSPILDYNLGRCHHNLGQSKEAIVSYQRYLEATPDVSNREQVMAWIKDLEQKSGEVKDPYPELGQMAQPSSQPATSAAETQPSSPQEPTHEAQLPQSWSAPTVTRKPPPTAQGGQAPLPQPQRPAEGPVYKQWWFWAGCAGAALIATFIIYTAASSGNSSTPIPQTQTRGLIFHF